MNLSMAKLAMLARKAVRRIGHDIGQSARIRYEMSFLVEILARHRVSVVLDIGANVGQWAAELRRAGYGGRIVSFEPVSNAYERIAVASRGDAAWTVAPRMALADRDGMAEINVASNTPMSSLLPIMAHTVTAIRGADTVGKESVPVARLDTLFGQYVGEDDVVFVKVDVQGAEKALLDGAAASLPRIAGIQLEMSFARLYEREVNAFELYRIVDDAGFAPVLFVPGYFSSELARQLQVDGVFFKKDHLA